ncbi:hypothetical protein EJB05_37378 [Eragrostis curvula]|uniref:Knottin scorpion toxin-like domain-containing protein n=1 Tax=Eragrostis curvula TaxID=38414 RepID=A0A5J9TSZ8_9POAL|nr:hypothetical protein EJB05_37378 [Eragrostis curvula]
MAPRRAVALIVMLVVSHVFADQTKGDLLVDRIYDQELSPSGGGLGLQSQCHEAWLYTGPCIELMCTTACMLQFHNGGHCTGKHLPFLGKCYCFACS